MRLYHTGRVEIRTPDIHYGRVNADFGQGFYMTPDKEFTYRWAPSGSVINVYELDTAGLKVHTFQRDTDWFQYIFSNRRAQDTIDADVVIGPIANDTIYDTLGILTSGFLTPEESLKILRIGPEYTQVAIKSEKALGQLRWIETEQDAGKQQYAQLLKKEQEEYQILFAKAMEEL